MEIRQELVNYYIDTHTRPRTPALMRVPSDDSPGAHANGAIAASELAAPRYQAVGSTDGRDAQVSFCTIASASSHECDQRLIVAYDTEVTSPSANAVATSCHSEIAAAPPLRPDSAFVTFSSELHNGSMDVPHRLPQSGRPIAVARAPARMNPPLDGPATKTWIVLPTQTQIPDGDDGNAIAEASSLHRTRARGDAPKKVIVHGDDAVYAYGSLRGANARVYSVNCVFARRRTGTPRISKPLLVLAPALRVGMAPQVLRRPILAIARKLKPQADTSRVEWVMPIHPSVDTLLAALPHWSRMVTLARSGRASDKMEVGLHDPSETEHELAKAACTSVQIGSVGAKLSRQTARSLSSILLRSGYRGSPVWIVRSISQQPVLLQMQSRWCDLASTQINASSPIIAATPSSLSLDVTPVKMSLPARLALLQITTGPMQEDFRTYIRRPTAGREDPIFSEPTVHRHRATSARLLARANQRERMIRSRANSASRFAA